MYIVYIKIKFFIQKFLKFIYFSSLQKKALQLREKCNCYELPKNIEISQKTFFTKKISNNVHE